MNLNKCISVFVILSLFFVCACSKQSNFEKALAYQKDGDYKKAIEFYKKACVDNDNIVDAEENLANIYFADNNYDYAFYCYKKAVELGSIDALETVIKLSSHNEANVRNFVAATLSSVNKDSSIKYMFLTLSNILKSNDDNKIMDIIELISKTKVDMSPISKDIIALLDSDNVVVKQKVLGILPKFSQIIASDSETFDKLLNFLDQDNEMLKLATINCLGDMKKYAKKAILNLIYMAVNEPKYKEQIFVSIKKIGVPLKEQAEQMYSILSDKTSDIKIKVLETFGDMPENSKCYVPCIMLFLNDEDLDVKYAVRDILSKIGKPTIETVPALINLLQSENTEIVTRAIYELGDLGKDAIDAVEDLKKIESSTNNKEIRKLVQEALQKIQK